MDEKNRAYRDKCDPLEHALRGCEIERTDDGFRIGDGATIAEIGRRGDGLSGGHRRGGGGGDGNGDGSPHILGHGAVASAPARVLPVAVRHVGASPGDEDVLDIGVVPNGLRRTNRLVVEVGGHWVRAVGAEFPIPAVVVGEGDHIGRIGGGCAGGRDTSVHEGLPVVVVVTSHSLKD